MTITDVDMKVTAASSEVTTSESTALPSTMDQEPAQKRVKLSNVSASKEDDERKSPSNRKSTQRNDDMEWICGECKEADCMMVPSASEFLICDGKCHRVFHYPCAGFSQLPEGDDEWICKDCSAEKHQCAVCHEYGQDDEDVFLCRHDKCGLFFHESCLDLLDVEVTRRAVNKTTSDFDDAEDETTVPVFTCPAHNCWTCTQKDMLEKEKEQELAKLKDGGARKKKRKKKTKSVFQVKPEKILYRCVYCPIAYHVTCIPPTCRFHELAVLCHEHSSTHKLPDLDLASSFQGKVEEKLDKRFSGGVRKANRKMGKDFNPFFPGLRGDRMTSQDKQFMEYVQEQQKDSDVNTMLSDDGDIGFCLSCEMKNEVHSKPPVYKHLNGLKYDPNNRPPRLAMSNEKCQCEKQCDEHCFNRMTLIECHGSNCAVGEKCGNRALSKREYAKCKPKREGGKGWGLVTVNDIPKGKLVQEYVGKVIDEKEKEKRLIDWNREHAHNHDFYIMAISKDWFIDAREHANMSRFINHSCEPNCMLITINVKGYKRNGIYSLRDIKAGEFLCYDYKFDTNQGDRFLCRCGAKKCRGTMKGGNQLAGTKTPTTWKEAKAQYDLDKKFLKDVENNAVISQVDALVPAATKDNEYVSGGPLEHERTVQASYRVFLWRNVRVGADFVARNSRLEAGVQHKRQTQASNKGANETIDMLSLIRKFNGER